MRKVDIHTIFRGYSLNLNYTQNLVKEGFSVSIGVADPFSGLAKKTLETKTDYGRIPFDAIKKNNRLLKKIVKAAGGKISLEESYYIENLCG
ncbi:MAG TPA: hypothetical protein VJA86_00680 [Candidatus Nanoarchaeia archaeon]|nr:hypothetical protein [Candidatus Nanoarchaeia archaeon]